MAAVHVDVVVEDAAGVPEGEALYALQAGFVGEGEAVWGVLQAGGVLEVEAGEAGGA